MILFPHPIALHRPFSPEHTPWLARLFAYAYKLPRSRGEAIATRWAKRLFKIAFFLHIPCGAGSFVWRPAAAVNAADGAGAASELKHIRFNLRNTQFESVYRKEYQLAYEPETCLLLQLFMPTNGVFFDIGANWGYFSLFTASLPGFSGRICAFEPMQNTYQDLVQVVESAGLASSIQCIEMALSNRQGNATMVLPDSVQSGAAEMSQSAHGSAVTTCRLDDLTDLPAPSFLKMDVEGHELEALEGAQAVIANAKPMVLVENKVDGQDHLKSLAALQWLEQQGYQLFVPAWTQGGTHQPLGYRWHSMVSKGSTPRLALYAIDAQSRPLFKSVVNIFACHKDKLEIVRNS